MLEEMDSPLGNTSFFRIAEATGSGEASASARPASIAFLTSLTPRSPAPASPALFFAMAEGVRDRARCVK